MTRFTFDNHRLTIENIGDADRAVVEIEIDSQDGDECYASVAIPDTEVPRIASALLEAAGYGETDTPEVLRSQNPGKLFISAARRRAKLDELTRTASEDGTADDVDEYVNTRPKFSPGDRVRHVAEESEDSHGRVVASGCTDFGCDVWRFEPPCQIVRWDDGSHGHYSAQELEKTEDKSKPKFSPGDRVYRRLFPHHGHGTVHYVRKDGTPRVLWDAEPANFHDPNLLEKVGEWL